MSNTTTARDAALDEIYARIPAVNCKGLCADDCGPIGMSNAEVQRMTDNGVQPPDMILMMRSGCHTCPLLDVITRRCNAYQFRPLVCRLYGVVKEMKCRFGCAPTELVTDAQARTMFRKVGKI